MDRKTTSRTVILSKDINWDLITKNGVFTRMVNSKDGDVLMKCKSDGVTSTTNTGLVILMSANSMHIKTQTSTKTSMSVKKPKKMIQIPAVKNDPNYPIDSIYLY